MKHIMKTFLIATALGTALYAGGDMKVVTEVEPYVKTPAAVEEASSFYMGLGVSVSQVNSYFYGKDTAVDVTAKAGYDFSKYLGVEARGSYGIKDGNQLGHDYSYGLYLKPMYPLNKAWTLYGLAGYAQTKISFENEVAFNGITNNYTTQNSFAYGVGLSYKLNQKWSLFVDAMRLIDKSITKPEGIYASKVDGITFGFAYHF